MAVGGTGVAVGGTGVAVGGTGVAVGGTGVAVGGTGMTVAATTIKSLLLVVVPPGDRTQILPVVASVGITAETAVSDRTEKLVASISLNLTPFVPLRFVPVIVTVDPTAPLIGVKPLRVGAGSLVYNFSL